MVRGCALIDSRLDTAKICSDGRVEVHRARLRAVFGGRKTFPHGLGQTRTQESEIARFALPHEPTCSGCPQSKHAASAPSLAASAGLALPRSREGKSRPARDATHTSGLFEFNSEILRMNQAHRS